MGQNSAEYRAVLKHMNDLLLSIENDLSAVIANLTSRLLISPEQGRAIISMAAARINKDGAYELLYIILNKIEINEENYHKFVRVLMDGGATYTAVIKQLESTYASFAPSTCASTAAPMETTRTGIMLELLYSLVGQPGWPARQALYYSLRLVHTLISRIWKGYYMQ